MAQSLDFSLRCNSLTCRKVLTDQAVVTTCSHIFCLSCAGNLGLTRQTQQSRTCPACQANLPNPDDVVSTILNPTEDYKTSVLSGLDPTTVIECAGRAFSFWAYQTTQEICYQEYLSKGLTEKYGSLNTEKETLINSANIEISSLQNKLADMQQAQDQLQKKNDELIALYQEKCKKHTQMTNLYNLLKSRAMRSQIQTAASDSVSQTLKFLPQATNNTRLNRSLVLQTAMTASRHFDALSSTEKRNGKNSTERLFRHQRSGSASSKSKEDPFMARVGAMPPPQLPFSVAQNPVPTTSHHRTRLPAQPEPEVFRENREQMDEPKYFANHGRFRDFSYNPG
ncbi:hypothetical protein EYB25_000319 [Talaromyces marneffei]|uniref:uncharacterized protein n=1 Tax=Talaromyces marneffei TaxID=37727 RepID=UPI0012AA346F|nr:uncharacterized protein EYB26_002034 [Talaromyces marneffei]KAE8555621.1 hypothetical protein EYB25_000319 [Talaromyces marneffei]QGA14381.1 hypothetical protein EYB26_002034 [Talaromyces marneffei]